MIEFPTLAWAKAFRDEVNKSEFYKRAAPLWKYPILLKTTKNGTPYFIFLEFLPKRMFAVGVSLKPEVAHKRAELIIEGSYESWVRVLRDKEVTIAKAIDQRDLKMVKGSNRIVKLLNAVNTLVACTTSAGNIVF